MRRVRGVHATTASHAAVACASARRASARATLFARRSRLFIALATLTTLHFSDSKRSAISGACAVSQLELESYDETGGLGSTSESSHFCVDEIFPVS